MCLIEQSQREDSFIFFLFISRYWIGSSLLIVSFSKKNFFREKNFFSAVRFIPVPVRAVPRIINNNHVISLYFYWTFRIRRRSGHENFRSKSAQTDTFQPATTKNEKSASAFPETYSFFIRLAQFLIRWRTPTPFRTLSSAFQKLWQVFLLFSRLRGAIFPDRATSNSVLTY